MALAAGDELVTIGEASARVGVSASAIRFYDGAKLIGELPRTSGRRMFDSKALTRLRFIRAAQALGFSLDEIRDLLHPTVQPEWAKLVATKRTELVKAQRNIQSMVDMLDDSLLCGCEAFENCPILLEDDPGADGC